MHTLKYYLLLVSLVTWVYVTSPVQMHAAFLNPTCPGNNDITVYNDPVNNNCYSSTNSTHDTGVNVVENTGGPTCGQVACIGDKSGTYRFGHTCITSSAGICHPGYGSSGFNSTNCVADALAPAPITCPSPMNLTIQVIDDANPPNPVSGITFTINYGDAPPAATTGYTTTAVTDATGKAVISNKLYSGDHFTILPSSPNYTFEPNQYGNSANLGVFEMNTVWSCGTALGNGTSNDPCLFIAHPAGKTVTPPTSCTDCLARTPSQNFFCTNAVSGQSICSGLQFKPFQCTQCQLPPTTQAVKSAGSYLCSSLQGRCKTVNSCINGQELDVGNMECGVGSTCCGPKPYAPNLTATLLIFGALAAIGLLF